MARPSPYLQPDDLFGGPAPSGDCDVEVAGATLALTSLERVYFPEAGATKADLLRYYHRVAPALLPHLRDRPLILKRYPEGAAGPHFFQHEAGDVPAHVRTAPLVAESGRHLAYLVGGDEPTLLWMANRGAIECHAWHARLHDLDHPDRLVLDLDPSPGVAFEAICRLALVVRGVLDDVGLAGYPKTSGSRGLHVYVPVEPRYPFAGVAAVAEALARRVTEAAPSLTTLVRDPADRPASTIYVDHLQNARGKSVVAPYSVRARPGATVSTPLTWEEVEAVPDPAAFTIATVPERIASVGELFVPVLDELQPLEEAGARLKALT